MSGHEEELVAQAFESNWIAPLGPFVDAFEAALAEVTQRSHCAALSSGTAAIHLGLMLLGVEPGDSVLCQSFTFAGTLNPVAYLNAKPILIDSEADTWNMDPAALRAAIEAAHRKGIRPKAIVVVHLYGMPAKMREILDLAHEFEIPVFEDAAEALGSRYDDRPCGSFGAVSALSFNGNKIVTTSGGGALLADDSGLIQRARFLATQARDPAPHYQHSSIGYNYRLSNILAAIGLAQLRALPERVAARRANFARYCSFLSAYGGVSVQREPSARYFSNRWLTTMVVNPAETGGVDRERIRLALADANIEARPLWMPMHMQPVFKDCTFVGDGVSEKLFQDGLCLPSGSSLTDADRTRIFATLSRVLETG